MRSLVGVLLVVAACQPSSRVHLPIPALGAAQTILVAVHSELGLRVWVFAFGDETFEVELAPVDQNAELLVEVIALPMTNDALNLQRGELVRSTSATSVPLPIGYGAIAFNTAVADRRPTDWVEGPPSDRLLGFRIEDPMPCPRLELVDQAELGFVEFGAVVALPNGRVIARERFVDDEIILLTSDADTITQLRLSTDAAFTLGTVDERDQLWLGDDQRIYRADLVEGIGVTTATVAVVPGSRARGLGVFGGSYFVHERNGDFWRIDADGTTELLFEFDDVRGHGLFAAPVVLDPVRGRILTTNSRTNQTVLYEDGAVVELPPLDEEGLRGAAWSRGLGTFVIGTIDANLYRLEDHRWVLLPRSGINVSQVRVIAAVRDGFVFAAGDIIGQYGPGGFCREEIPGAEVLFLSAFDDRLHMILDGNPSRGSSARVEVRALVDRR